MRYERINYSPPANPAIPLRLPSGGGRVAEPGLLGQRTHSRNKYDKKANDN
jgi:hypothetical protein